MIMELGVQVSLLFRNCIKLFTNSPWIHLSGKTIFLIDSSRSKTELWTIPFVENKFKKPWLYHVIPTYKFYGKKKEVIITIKIQKLLDFSEIF